MNKEQIRAKVQESPLSAQEYNSMTADERKILREVLVEDNKDPDEEERKMKSLWPKKFTPKELHWRNS